MSRDKVWVDAYEKYAVQKYADNMFTISPDKIRKMSDDELHAYVFEEVHKLKLEDEFDKFVRKYCMQYK